MKGSMIALDHIAGAEAAARVVNGKLDDLIIDIPTQPRPGTVYSAICDRPMKGQGGMFLRLPDGEKAFLRHAKGFAPGQSIRVQVTGYAEPGKAVPVTTKLLFKSRYAIVTPGAPGRNISRQIKDDEERDRLTAALNELHLPEGAGLILRSACANADLNAILEDAEAMADLAESALSDIPPDAPAKLADGDGPHVIAWREWGEPDALSTNSGCFEETGTLDLIEDGFLPEVPLSEGASMFVEPTRALVAVDVNTGGNTSAAAGLKANISAARELPRILRFRGLGGQIVVDFAPMPKAQRRQVESSLRAGLKSDPVDTTLVGWTPLGHLELQRKRERAPLDAIIQKVFQ